MVEGTPSLFVFNAVPASREEFVRFWAACYKYPDCELYTPNIIGSLTPAKLEALFRWKIGKRFFESHWPVVQQLFVARLDEALALPPDVSAAQLLTLFPRGGAVYRIFWLHCLRPDRFHICDQHVHRAMNLIEKQERRELSEYTEKQQVALYLERYLPFWNRHFGGLDPREVDRALWAFGKFMKDKGNTPFARIS
jgi:hypothetical protein